ncbi:hypothetical protein [Nocardioides litoris]|uniref:hypothetical protein n=1 Tax=Nocardioides litoris TaxID=1926648 RepID=UPI00112233F1|nr:hypothetical protein [Nocardioides litoris]
MTLRPPLVAVVLAPVVCVALLAGCSGDDGPGPAEPSSTPTDDLAGVPAAARALCAPFRAAYARIAEGGALPDDPAAPVPADVVDAYRDLGTAITEAGSAARPEDMTDDQAAGLAVLSQRLEALPDDATGADLAAVEGGLDPDEGREVAEARAWVASTCDVTGVGR